VVHLALAIRLVHCLGWVFKKKERMKVPRMNLIHYHFKFYTKKNKQRTLGGGQARMAKRKPSQDPESDGGVGGYSSTSPGRREEEEDEGCRKRARSSKKDNQNTKRVYKHGKSVLAARAGMTHAKNKGNKEQHFASRKQRDEEGEERKSKRKLHRRAEARGSPLNPKPLNVFSCLCIYIYSCLHILIQRDPRGVTFLLIKMCNCN